MDKPKETVEAPVIETPKPQEEAPVVPVVVPDPAPAAPVVPAEPVVEAPIAEVLPQEPVVEKPAETVPLATFLEVKKDAKELRKDLEDLQEKVRAGLASPVEITADIEAIGKEYEVDPGFLAKLTTAIKTQVRGEAAAEREAIDAPAKAAEAKRKFDETFKTHFDKAMAGMPEFKEIVNEEVIKTLSRDPKNAKKTFTQLIEETYGAAVPGKRTIEGGTPGGGNEPEAIDYKRAAREPEYLSTILANPAMKKEYNENLHKRLSL